MYSVNEQVETVIESIVNMSMTGLYIQSINESANAFIGTGYDLLIEAVAETADATNIGGINEAFKQGWDKAKRIVRSAIDKIWGWIKSKWKNLKDLKTAGKTLKGMIKLLKKKRELKKDGFKPQEYSELSKMIDDLEKKSSQVDKEVETLSNDDVEIIQPTHGGSFDTSNSKNAKYKSV